MSEPVRPFRVERDQLHSLRDGRALTLSPFTPGAADILGPATAAIVGPWAHYGFDSRNMAAVFKSSSDGASRYQLEYGGELAGAVVITSPWLSGPYLQMLAILPAHQNQGIGATILVWFESEARGHFRNLWLCVSGFNIGAQCFYQAHGYERTATLDGLMRDDDDELLMRKRIAP